MLFPYLFAYNVDSVINLVFLFKIFVFMMFKLPQKYIHGQCGQNTNNVQKMNKNDFEEIKIAMVEK